MNDQQRRKIANAHWPVLVDQVLHHGPVCQCPWCSAPPKTTGHARWRSKDTK